jgi:hypothetical protein
VLALLHSHRVVGPANSPGIGLFVRIVRVGSTLAAVFSAHAAVNRRLMRIVRIEDASTPISQRVSVLIPARNEAHRIAPTLRSLQHLDWSTTEVIVLDDHSSDGTADVVRGLLPTARVIEGEDLPDGWLGKPWACEQLGRAAGGEVFVFLDADVWLSGGAIPASIAVMRRHNLALLSPYPRQTVGSLGERVVQPLLQWLWLTFLPLRLAERPSTPSMTAANGQLLLIDAAMWRSIGGHGSVRDAVIEDVELARHVKRAGGRATVADGSEVVSCRMYDGWDDLSAGYTKSLWAALPSRAVARVVGGVLALAYLVPPFGLLIGLLTRRNPLSVIGGVGYAAAITGRVVSARATGGRASDAALHPASVLSLLWLGRRSFRAKAAGTLSWKGRLIGGAK